MDCFENWFPHFLVSYRTNLLFWGVHWPRANHSSKMHVYHLRSRQHHGLVNRLAARSKGYTVQIVLTFPTLRGSSRPCALPRPGFSGTGPGVLRIHSGNRLQPFHGLPPAISFSCLPLPGFSLPQFRLRVPLTGRWETPCSRVHTRI